MSFDLQIQHDLLKEAIDMIKVERDELRAKLDASEKELEEAQRVLRYCEEKLMRKGDHSLPEAVDRWVADYVPRAEVDAAWRKGMTDAAKIARDLVVDEAHNAPHNWITSDAIIDARDKRKESGE